jgi:long-chain acyl-CoA synthetase
VDDVARRVAERPATLAHMLWTRAAATPHEVAYRYPVAGPGGEVWQDVTWGETRALVEPLAAGLVELGVGVGDRVAILSRTRVDWVLAHLAVLCSGAATVAIDPGLAASQVADAVDGAGCSVVFAEDLEQVAKLWAVRAAIRTVRRVVLMDGEHRDRRVMTSEALLELGDEVLARDPGLVDERVRDLRPDQLAAILPTCAAADPPRGARLRHSACTYVGAAVAAQDLVGPRDRQLLWVPLWESFGQALLATGLAAGFPTAVDGRADRVLDDLALHEPTFVGVTPRLLEQVRARVAPEQGRSVPVRDLVGARFRFFLSAGQPLDADLVELLHVAGLTVLEGYGRTESAGPTCVNLPADHRLGTAGRPLPGTEVRIAEDGEVLVRGPGVMEQYHERPAETASVLVDGWLRTGDVGHLEPDGHLVVAGRRRGR